MIEETIHAKLLTKDLDMMGYTTYVFENLEYDNWRDHYIMCVRFPNWDQKPFSIGDIGFLKVRYVEGGKDKWYDGKDFNFYRYTNVIFMKFILEKPLIETEIILD